MAWANRNAAAAAVAEAELMQRVEDVAAETDEEIPLPEIAPLEQVLARARHLGDLTDATAKVMKEIEKTVNKANGNRADMLKTLSDFVDGLRC